MAPSGSDHECVCGRLVAKCAPRLRLRVLDPSLGGEAGAVGKQGRQALDISPKRRGPRMTQPLNLSCKFHFQRRLDSMILPS